MHGGFLFLSTPPQYSNTVFVYIAVYMKQPVLYILLFAITGLCFQGGENDPQKDKGSFYATVDGKMFKLRDDQLFRGILVSKSASMDGRTPSRTVMSTTFNGVTYDKPDKSPFNESVAFEMSYEDSKTGAPDIFSVALQYNSTDYSMVKESSKIKITQFVWETDHKHFHLSADFDCQMRSWGYPSDNKKDVNLKGHMTNIRITVPSWLASKTPAAVAK
jgi:hypothetical protein